MIFSSPDQLPTVWTDSDIRHRYQGWSIAIGGPKHSGKSIFIAELYRQILARHPDKVFRQPGCPDGEGMWSSESDPVLVAKIRQKGEFLPEFVDFTLKSLENLGQRFPLLLVDLGGLRSAQNAEILLRCTHFILLSSDPKEDSLWQTFAVQEGCRVLACLRSTQIKLPDDTLDYRVRSHIDTTTQPITGELFNLDREGDSITYRDAVGELAQWLSREL